MRERLIRTAGPAAIVGGVLYVGTFVMVYLVYRPFGGLTGGTFLRSPEFVYALYAPMYASLLLGSLGLYLCQRDGFGPAGKAGFCLTALGFSLGALGSAALAVTGADPSALLRFVTHAVAHGCYAIGSLLLGLATFRVGVLPRAAAVMMGVGPALQAALFPLGTGGTYPLLFLSFAVTALGWVWLGRALPAAKPGQAPAVQKPLV